MHHTAMLKYLAIVLCLIPAKLCSEDATTMSNAVAAEETTVKLNTALTGETTAKSNAVVTDELTFKPNVIIEVVDDPTTSDVCSMSLTSLSELNVVNYEKCKCTNLNEFVDCKFLHISELPKLISFPKATRVVSFEGNKIENLNEDIFYSGKNVSDLDLSHNRINFVSSKAFEAFKKLRKLDISHNKIWNMPEKSLQGLTELQYLNLGYNDMVSVSPNLFAATNNLKELILESNPLQELEPKFFEHLPKLEVLDLESTLLKVIPDHLFIFTPRLQILDISSNQLNRIPSDALKPLDNLKWLDLSGNPVKVIHGGAFFGMRLLVGLYLERMPLLTKIENYAFGDLQQLHELHCSYNFFLSDIGENAFVRKVDNQKVPLSQLFLRQNALNTIPERLLSWNDEIELHADNNPISCDCNTQWMVTLKLKNDMQNHVRCSSPSHLEGVALSHLKDHELSCGLEVSEILLIVCSVVVALLILTLIIAFLVWRRNYAGYTKPYYTKKNVEEVDYTGDDDI